MLEVLTTDSNGSKSSASGLSRIQPRMTMAGITKSAVCYVPYDQNLHAQGGDGDTLTMVEPTATLMLSVS